MKNQLYIRYDLQDDTEKYIETLAQMKEWLIHFWNSNPDEDMSDSEHEHMIEQIWRSNENELLDSMLGIDYCFEEFEGDDLNE